MCFGSKYKFKELFLQLIENISNLKQLCEVITVLADF